MRAHPRSRPPINAHAQGEAAVMTSKKFLELGIGLPLQQGSLDRLKERYASL
jgi:hypothetical protein